MFNPSQILWFLCLISLFLIQPCLSIKCWVCRSDDHANCADPFKNETLRITDCSLERLITIPDARAHMCRKIKQRLNGTWSTIRSCGFLGKVGVNGSEKLCNSMSNKAGNVFIEHCSCNSKDGCNGSNSMSASSVILAITLSITAIANISNHQR